MSENNPIENTAAVADTQAGAEKLLMDGMVDQMLGKSAGSSIERMEAEGQRQVCAQETRLPTDFNEFGDRVGSGRDALTEAGVVFGECVPSDDIWTQVELPAGWKISPTDHAMWSKLTDNEGRHRAAIFYKAAFYDRGCHIDVVPRYRSSARRPEDYDSPGPYVPQIEDAGAVIWEGSPLHKNPGESTSEVAGRAELHANVELKVRFPNHRELAAYW